MAGPRLTQRSDPFPFKVQPTRGRAPLCAQPAIPMGL